MLRRCVVLRSANQIKPSVQDVVLNCRRDAMVTDLPGIPHAVRVCRLYRQWLKLAVLCPPSLLCELNEHAQMNERFVVIIRQKFREGAEKYRAPAHTSGSIIGAARRAKESATFVDSEGNREALSIMVQSCERSLNMFRALAADSAKRKYPEGKPRLNLHKMGFMEMGKINFTQMAKEYWNTYIMRRW